MQVPAAAKPAFWGAVGGAIALAIVGFNWGGWVSAHTAKTMASRQSRHAVVKALVPYCVARFEQMPDASAQWTKLKKTDDYDQGSMLEKIGVVVLPGTKLGSDETDNLASACAEKLVAMKELAGVKVSLNK